MAGSETTVKSFRGICIPVCPGSAIPSWVHSEWLQCKMVRGEVNATRREVTTNNKSSFTHSQLPFHQLLTTSRSSGLVNGVGALPQRYRYWFGWVVSHYYPFRWTIKLRCEKWERPVRDTSQLNLTHQSASDNRCALDSSTARDWSFMIIHHRWL